MLAFLVLINGLMLVPCEAQLYDRVDWGLYFQDTLTGIPLNFGKNEYIGRILVHGSNPESVYVVGQTYAAAKSTYDVCSEDHEMELGGGNGFLAKFSSCGELIWSAYVGKYAQVLAIDSLEGNLYIYVAGKTSELKDMEQPAFACDGNEAPVFQALSDDKNDAFICKFLDKGNSVSLLRWTYFGGTSPVKGAGVDNALGIGVANHSVILTGFTNSVNMQSGAKLLGDSTYNGSGDSTDNQDWDSYIAVFDSLLSELKFFTYIGGIVSDRSHDIQVRYSDSGLPIIYISGTSNSPFGIASGSGFDQVSTSTDAFVQKWEDADLNGVYTQSWGTYVGGSRIECGRSIIVDKNDNLYLTGFTKSSDLPVTPYTFDSTLGTGINLSGSSWDAFLIKINRDGGNEWCTYFGGNEDEKGVGIELISTDSGNILLLAGLTSSPSNSFDLSYPFQDYLNGNDNPVYNDVFISGFLDATSAQQLLFSTYLGGSDEEGLKYGAAFHPIISLGNNDELYVATATASMDMDDVVGFEFEEIRNSYSGESDAFITKLIKSDDANQQDCNWLGETPRILSSNEHNDASPIGHRFKLYPNPCFDEVCLEINFPWQTEINVSVVNLVLQVAATYDLKVDKGVRVFCTDFEQLAPGVYVMQILENTGSMMSQLRFIME